MIDIEDVLEKTQTPKPNRQLSAHFTDHIVDHLNAYPIEHMLGRRAKAVLHWLRRRAGLVSLSGLLLVGGTAAAITFWPTPSVKQTVADKPLPNGNRIVGYNTQNCDYFSNASDNKPVNTSENVYYEVRKGSKLADQQLRSSLQGVCEENVSNDAIAKLAQQINKQDGNHRYGFSTNALTVKSVTATIITAGQDPAYGAAIQQVNHDITYYQFAKNLRVYNEDTPIAFSDIKVGDDIKMLIEDTRASSGYMQPGPGDSQPESDPRYLRVYAIMKIPALTGDPTVFYGAVAQDLVRLDTCTTSPSGFCEAYQFAR
jgi:hypothetical protein